MEVSLREEMARKGLTDTILPLLRVKGIEGQVVFEGTIIKVLINTPDILGSIGKAQLVMLGEPVIFVTAAPGMYLITNACPELFWVGVDILTLLEKYLRS